MKQQSLFKSIDSTAAELPLDPVQTALDSGTITIEFKDKFIIMVCPDGSKKSFPFVPGMGLYQIASTCFSGPNTTQSKNSMSHSVETPEFGFDEIDFDSYKM